MSLAIVNSRAQVGTSAPEVFVEVHLARGLPRFSIVGLPEMVVKESRDRVRAAIINSNFEFPYKRVSVNLAPADLPKEGGRFDLPIALGVLAATNQIPKSALRDKVFLGELAFSGELRDIGGSLIAALSLKGSTESLILPETCAAQAALVQGVNVYGVGSLLKLSSILNGLDAFSEAAPVEIPEQTKYPDMSEVIGQTFSKFALEVAASGAHSVLMMGSPGTGKTMIASRLPGILPEMSEQEALETAAINSLVDKDWGPENWRCRPFRAPHHSASGAALIGGGTIPKPGEISQAHNGVLFLDELTEFDRRSLELLREPLESGHINISRAAMQLKFLSRFIFVGAANPCKCGYLGDSSGKCKCTPDQIQRYLSKLSGPLLDRIDIQLYVPKVPHYELRRPGMNMESSADIRERVIAARAIQHNRQGKLNSQLSTKEIGYYCELDDNGYGLLDKVILQFNMSARGYHRILKLSRTVADMKNSSRISEAHLSTAIKMRCMDRNLN
ncbi:YifB family Mg chelatase-like AAA ATPase [Candidatus Spongiihabitans sp.]|uniref:YifB family Mg chelatase-like AAA ATPase n=1 Tax=Candidatus Spongiihabitans sp. TaxID=3101308 RepID=UPI003C6ED58D